MATKTISVDLEAYERLRAARRAETESFSKVIKRARWSAPPKSAQALLDALADLPPLDDATANRLDRNQQEDKPPEDPWTNE